MWIATVGGLDWPHSHDIVEQKRSLLDMLSKLKDAHFNTIIFQVRGRGDVMYRSPREPWSDQLTGTLGKDPGWDPLSFVVEQAHHRGFEVHAWFNTFLLKNGKAKPPDSVPRHLLFQHPEWAKLVENDWWLDPGLPAVRQFLIASAMDIVRRYDVDGIQFDFIRYPGKLFPDDASYRRYGQGLPREDWRRNNINQFVRTFHDSAMAVRPMLKIGATPIGIYTNVTRNGGWQGYYDLYQDSRGWLRNRTMDYLAPQVYWSLGDKPGNPDFSALTRDWAEHSFGREVWIGIGAYKPEVHKELPELIDSVRSAGAEGVAYFRYEHISDALDLGSRYRTLANIPPMNWKDSIPPNPPRNLTVRNAAEGIIELRWDAPSAAVDRDTARYYDIYRSQHAPIVSDEAENLRSITTTGANSFVDTIGRGMAAEYYYAVSALDKGNNESPLATVARVLAPEIVSMSRAFELRNRLGSQVQTSSSDLFLVQYEIGESAPVVMKILDESNREVVSVVDAVQPPGRYVAAADLSNLRKGTYACLLVAGSYTSRKSFVLNH